MKNGAILKKVKEDILKRDGAEIRKGACGSNLEHIKIGEISCTPFVFKKGGKSFVEFCVNGPAEEGPAEYRRLETAEIGMEDLKEGLVEINKVLDRHL